MWLVDSQNVDDFREVSSVQPPAHVSVNHATISNYCIHSGVQCKYQGSACGAHKYGIYSFSVILYITFIENIFFPMSTN